MEVNHIIIIIIFYFIFMYLYKISLFIQFHIAERIYIFFFVFIFFFYFSLASLHFISPNEYTVVATSQPLIISFTANYVNNSVGMDIYLKQLESDNVTLTNVMTLSNDNTVFAENSLSFILPSNLLGSDNYVIEIVPKVGSGMPFELAHFVSSNFTIEGPAVLGIATPDSSSIWDVRKQYTIEWDQEFFSSGASLRIELWRSYFNTTLSQFVNTSVTTVTSSVDATSGFYDWTIPYDIPSGNMYFLLIGQGDGSGNTTEANLAHGWGPEYMNFTMSTFFTINGGKCHLIHT